MYNYVCLVSRESAKWWKSIQLHLKYIASTFVNVKLVHIHRVLRKMCITLVWNVQLSFFLQLFHIIILSIFFFFWCMSNFNSLLHYWITIMILKQYTILHIKSSHPNFEVIVNLNVCLYSNARFTAILHWQLTKLGI